MASQPGTKKNVLMSVSSNSRGVVPMSPALNTISGLRKSAIITSLHEYNEEEDVVAHARW
jgi:hypothetical protein